MNRNILNAVLLLSMGAGLSAVAQETNADGVLDWSSFKSIAQKNIFDPTRSGGRGTIRIARPRPAVVRTFTFHGTMDQVACFTGDGVPSSGYVSVGDTINGFKVMKIPVEYVELPTVVLTDPNGSIVVLKEDESMRREEDGPWNKSDQPAPMVIENPETRVDESDSTSSPAPADESEILKRLRLKREQEDK